MDLTHAREILDTAHNAVVSMDVTGRITYFNPAAEVMFGHASEAVIGQSLADQIIPEHYREAHWRGLQHFLETGEGAVLGRRVELSGLRSNGTEFPIEITISAQRDGESWVFHAFIQDISERVARERERGQRLAELETSLQGSEQRFEAILGALAEAVTIRNREDRIIYANPPALRQLGFASVEELAQAHPGDIMREYRVEGPDGGPLVMDDVPSVRLLRGEQPEPVLMRVIHHGTGVERWLLLKATPLFDPAGSIEATVTIIEDVTAAKRSELRADFLARASQVLGASLDHQRTLRAVAALAVPELADWCSVELVDEHGRRSQGAVAHRDPSKVPLVERLRELERTRLLRDQGIGRVIATGRAELYAQVSDAGLRSGVPDEAQRAVLAELGVRSAMLVPVNAGGRTIGVMTLVSSESDRRFGEADLEFASQLAERAAVAIANARLFTERAAIAETLQRSLLPDALPTIDGWDLAALYRAAGDGLEVGGDFYDVFAADDAWIVLIGDVTGKGAAAAAMTSLVRHSARVLAEVDPDPARILSRLNRILRGQASSSFCTALCMRLSGHEITFSVAGHPLPLLVDAGGIRTVGSPGALLGAIDESDWADETLTVQEGETILLYTDGVTDTVGDHDRFGEDRLHRTVGECAGQPASELLACIDETLNGFQVGPQVDDTAALALRVVPPGKADAQQRKKAATTAGSN